MNNIFDIENFNLIEDEENYYFFRSLEPGDLKDLENGTIKENNEYIRLRTDRERWEEEHPGESPRWNSESEVSLEEMYSHIKMHYSLQTNCISLSSNANVARTYGEAFSDKYVMIRVPKKEMGERVFHAGPYMLQEIEKIVNKEIEKQNLREDVVEDLKAIDEAKTSDEIKELIKTRYRSKEEIDVSKAGLKKRITYRSPHARISSYQSLNEDQTLEKNRIIGKLTVLERKQAMKPLMTRASSNNLLIQTVGSSFSSSEQIYYGDIEGDRITDISKEILDIFGLLQQVEGQDEEIVTELKREVIKFVNEKRQINIPEESLLKKQYNLKDNITIEEMYELTDGKVEYGIANSIVKNMFYLSKGQQEARQLVEILRNITNNNPRYERVIEYIKNNGFEIEPKISTRQSNKGYRLSESVNLDLITNEVPLVEAIKSLSTEEQIEILEKGGLSDTRNIITDTFSRVQRDEIISREEYYAGAIIDSYDWTKIGIEEFTIEQRSDLLKKLKEKDCVEIYKKLQDAGIPEKDIPLYLINIASKEQFSNILTANNYIELIRQNKEDLSQELSIPQIEIFLGYYNVEGTKIVLRDYQRNAVEKIDEIFENKRFASVLLPTGAGKTFVALTELLEHKNEPILYLAPRDNILEQTKDRIIEYIHGKQGTLGKSKDEIIAEIFPNIKFETYPGLLAKRGKEVIKDKYGFIVLDELHRTGAKEWETKLDELLENQEESTKVLGITATAKRDVDDRNMADEMALKLGYTKEEVQRREHIAMDMDLVDAIKLGLVVNPKIVSCEYTLKTDGSMENLLEKINSIEDEDIRKEKIEQYEKLRRKIDSAEGIPEILKQNIKSGGKYIVFIPTTDKGEELEDEDGNRIGKKTGREKIQEYEQKIKEYLKDSGLNPKCYSMLGAYSDKKNENQLNSFENDDSEDTKFMIVMNKANEGLHIKGIDGIVWFRALDENSKILYLQQLGRAIYSEDPNNPTLDEKRPVIIDLANNTLNVNIDKDIKNNTRRSDLELLSIVVDWVKLHNGLPNIDSTNKIEQRYAATLYRIQNEYMKYINGYEQFPDIDEEKKEQIEEILNKGAEIDLWDIELPPNTIQKANKLLEVNDFEVSGVMRDFIEFENEINGISNKNTALKNALEIERWCKKNYGDKKIWERRLPNKHSEDECEKKLGERLSSIRRNLKDYDEIELEEIENEEDRKIVEIVRKLDTEYGLGASLKEALQVKEWCQENFKDKKVWQKRQPVTSSKDEYERKLGRQLSILRSRMKNYEGIALEDITKEEDRQVVEIIRHLDDNYYNTYGTKYLLKTTLEIEFWCHEKYESKSFNERRVPSTVAKDEYERYLGNRFKYIQKKIKQYEGIELKDIKNEDERQVVEIIRRLDSEYNYRKTKNLETGIKHEKGKNIIDEFIEILEKLQKIKVDVSKLTTCDTVGTLAEKSGVSTEKIEEIGLRVNEKIGDRKTSTIKAYRRIGNYTPPTKEQIQRLLELGISLEKEERNTIGNFIEKLEKLHELGVDVSKIIVNDTIETLAKKSGVSKESLKEIGLEPDDKIGQNKVVLVQVYRGNRRGIPPTKEQVQRLLELGINLEKKKRKCKEIAEASISSIKDMELADAEDKALQKLVGKTKEGGINKDE